VSSLPSLTDVRQGGRFFFGLARLLRRPLTAAEAHAKLNHRLASRVNAFLALAREAIYGHPRSPYLFLLEQAGCEYGDLERLVEQEGLEGALQALFRRGIYLTVAEARGSQPIVRGSATLQVDPRLLRDPRVRADMESRSGGSRGRQAVIPMSFASVRDQALETFLPIQAHGGTNWLHANWTVPGSTAITQFVRYGLWRGDVDRWFTMVPPNAAGLHPRYEWSERALRLAARTAGLRVPTPTYVPVNDPMPIVRWMADALAAGRMPNLAGFVSGAVRVCQAAAEAGISLRGAKFSVGGEPLNAARADVVKRAGGEILLHYGSTETGGIGRGCSAPQAPDDLHVHHERLALLQPGPDGPPDLPATALLVTTLLPRVRLIMLNASIGDQAELLTRSCGCPLERLGWRTHIHTLRSFEKLTIGGMTFFDADVGRVLDAVLPARFGGGPTDYQLLEHEGVDGQSGLHLLVHPRLGALDEQAVRAAFLDAIGAGEGAERVMAQVWRDAGIPAVVRAAPRTAARGKINHLQVERPRPESAPIH
jgi:hypothetical protein